MKRKLLVLMAVLMAAVSVRAGYFEVDGIVYRDISEADRTVEVTFNAQSKYEGSVVIPEKTSYGGREYTVIGISEQAFFNCFGLTSLTINAAITSIGHDAFYMCNHLRSLEIPATVTSIGYNAFESCYILESLVLKPTTPPTIGANAFLSVPSTCVLTVPAESVAAYKAADGWKDFVGTFNSPTFEVDGIYYNVLSDGDGTTVEVTQKPNNERYEGDIVIPATVTYNGTTFSVKAIGDNAFEYSESLLSIVIPNSVESIGYQAFNVCRNLETLTMGTGVKLIGDQAFYYCEKLQPITLPEGLETIGQSAFYLNRCMTSIEIPSTVTSIGSEAFIYCYDLKNVVVKPTTPPTIGADAFKQVHSDCVFIVPAEALAAYKAADVWKDLAIIPSSFEADGIAYKLISGQDMTVEVTSKSTKYTGNIVIRNKVTFDGREYTVTTIGVKAFYECYDVTSVELPNSITRINDRAFTWCSKLSSVTIPSSVTNIGVSAFMYCKTLKNIIAKPTTPPTLGASYFSYIASDCVITVPGESYYAYKGTSGWTLHTLVPSNFMSDGIAYNLLSASARTVEVTRRPDKIRYGADDSTGGEIEYYEIPETVTYGGATFTVTKIGDEAFDNSYGMVTLKLPNSVTTIGKRAIANTYTLKNLELGTGIVTIEEEGLFYNENLPALTLPSSVKTIGDKAFMSCKALTSLNIPAGVESIGKRAFSYCYALEELKLEGTTPPTLGENAFQSIEATCPVEVPSTAFLTYKAADVWKDLTIQTLYEENNIAYHLISSPTANTAEVIANETKYSGKYTIPSSVSEYDMDFTVTAIGKEAFSECTGLKSIKLPETLTTIKEQAFYWCTGLTSVVIPNSVTTIERAAFNMCWGIPSINIPEGITELTDYVFEGCNFTSITIPSSVTSI